MGAPSSFVFSFYSDKYPEVELLDHVLVLFLQHSLFIHFHISGHLGLLFPFWIFFVFVFCEFFLGGGGKVGSFFVLFAFIQCCK